MPVEFISEVELPISKRQSKVVKTEEWTTSL